MGTDIHSQIKRNILGFTELCCLKSSKYLSPTYKIVARGRGGDHIGYAVKRSDGITTGQIVVETSDNPSVSLLQGTGSSFGEALTVNAQGVKTSSIIIPNSATREGLEEIVTPENTLSRLWDKAKLSVYTFVRKDGLPDNIAILSTLCVLSTAYERQKLVEPVLQRLGLA